MGTIQIKKVEKKVVTGKVGENRQKVTKTYGKIIYRGTLGLNEMAERIMKHGTVYTEDVVIGVITKLKNCIQRKIGTVLMIHFKDEMAFPEPFSQLMRRNKIFVCRSNPPI